MMTAEVQDNNMRILEFLGVKQRGKWFNGIDLQEAGLPFARGAYTIDDLKFHSSWDLLMKVVDVIDLILPDDSVLSIGYKTCTIPILSGDIDTNFDIFSVGETKFDAVYNAILEFIVWHKQAKSNREYIN